MLKTMSGFYWGKIKNGFPQENNGIMTFLHKIESKW